jgi:hypothetical protein
MFFPDGSLVSQQGATFQVAQGGDPNVEGLPRGLAMKTMRLAQASQ